MRSPTRSARWSSAGRRRSARSPPSGSRISAENQRDGRPYARKATIRGSANALINSRPTAVNLRWAVERVMARYAEVGELSDDGDAIADAMRAEADAIVFEATTDHGRLAGFGLEILPTPDGRPVRILTHCNTGPLACGQYGTALGVVQAAHHAGREVHVWVDETRPYLQGARLTTWELAQAGVPHALLPDVAAGHLMAGGEVDVVLVGADRVAANGDTANKVGTYTLAVLAARHGIPFYVCAPTSSVDLTRTGRRGHPDRGARRRRGPRVPRRAHRAVRRPRSATRRSTSRRPSSSPGSSPRKASSGPRSRPACARRVASAPWRAGPRCPASRAIRPPQIDDATTPAPTDSPPEVRLMATVAVGRRGAIVARATTDKALLRSFLERDRLYAAYAICDLEEREFARTRWGMAWDGEEPIALVLEYNGPTPQPLFAMGREDGIAAILRDLIRPRVAYVAAPATVPARHRDRLPRRPRARRWSGCGSTGPASDPYPATVAAPAAGRDRRAEPALPARLRLVAARERHRRGRLLRPPRQRPARRGGRAPTSSARAPAWPSSATS